MKVRQWVASVTAASVLVAGGLTAASLFSPSAGAQDSIPGIEAQGTTSDAHHPLRQALDGLVADGTLTRDQADKVYQSLVEARAANRQQRAAQRQQWQAAVAEAVGTTPDQLSADLKAGRTLAQIGEANGKTRQEVIDGLTAAVTARLDSAVANGTLTQDQAGEALERITARLDTVIDQQHPRARAGLRWLGRHGGAGAGATTSTTGG